MVFNSMEITNRTNYNIKVYVGERTPLQVEVVPTAVNTKTHKLKNGEIITNHEIAKSIKEFIESYIKNLGGI